MLIQPTIATTRLILRPLSQTDAPSIQALASERSIADTMISIPHPYPSGEAERYLDRQFAEFEAERSVAFAIERKFDSVLIGVIEIRDIEHEHSQAELSFWLAVTAWGQGYMSEALQPVIQVGFEPLKLNRLCAYHMVRNPGSGKVLQKNGFTQEGVLRQRVKKWEKFEDVALWAILQEDWCNTAAYRNIECF
jgi:[ribosomal protein S5]-alanine N-acetyltransferase